MKGERWMIALAPAEADEPASCALDPSVLFQGEYTLAEAIRICCKDPAPDTWPYQPVLLPDDTE